MNGWANMKVRAVSAQYGDCTMLLSHPVAVLPVQEAAYAAPAKCPGENTFSKCEHQETPNSRVTSTQYKVLRLGYHINGYHPCLHSLISRRKMVQHVAAPTEASGNAKLKHYAMPEENSVLQRCTKDYRQLQQPPCMK